MAAHVFLKNGTFYDPVAVHIISPGRCIEARLLPHHSATILPIP
jgi:hypothetical protein